LIDANKVFLKEVGLDSKQFKILLDNLPLAAALFKLKYNRKSKPINFVLLESNRKYDKIHFLKKVHIDKKANELNPKIKKVSIDWLSVYGNVATTGVPKRIEAYDKPMNKWYQIYVYSPQKTYCISMFMDITKQKRKKTRVLMEQKNPDKLIFSEKIYRRLYETSQDGIMARDLKGRMIDSNQAYAKMLGYTKKELKHLLTQQLLPEKWHEQREKILKKVLQTGRSIVFEREYIRKDGTVFPASVRTWRLTDGKGKVVGVWSIVRDITEQKELQRKLEGHASNLEKIIDERTKQLKDSERLVTIGQTAGMVGHDLRNPLQTIICELYLSKNEVKNLNESEAKNNLQESISVIEEQTVYMDKIVSDLQAFVQPVKIDKKPLILKDLVSDVLASVATPSNIMVETQIEDDFPQIKADLHLIKRVLINLVTNSIQAMPDGGKLILMGHVISGGEVLVAVQDTGVGIPEGIKNQIFTPLFTTKPRGQGFGLAVCKRVMEAHSGSISFESTVGKGAKFTIQFPTN
jgi:PAS domain S-box-containing protein